MTRLSSLHRPAFRFDLPGLRSALCRSLACLALAGCAATGTAPDGGAGETTAASAGMPMHSGTIGGGGAAGTTSSSAGGLMLPPGASTGAVASAAKGSGCGTFSCGALVAALAGDDGIAYAAASPDRAPAAAAYREAPILSGAGLCLVCRTARGICYNQRPLQSGADCYCADDTGMVKGAASASLPINARVDLASVVDVYFATDRQATSATAPEQRFGSGRGPLSYGLARVTVPPNHQTGYIESPSALVRIFLGPNANRHMTLAQAMTVERDDYFRHLRGRIAAAPKQDAFIFIHGFNVSFADAALRTAQMAFDLGFQGAPVFYSWPSQGKPSPLGYSADSQTIEWSQVNFEIFLKQFLDRTPARNVYLIGHSMGTQALTASLLSLLDRHPGLRTRITEVILAAPDIDAGVFRRDIAPRLVGLGRPVTLYASSQDLALKLSKEANAYPRAGDSGAGLILLDGIETIDASSVNTSFLGHSTFAEAREVLTDWQTIIENGLRARQRAGLRQLGSGIPYWVFRR